MNKISSHWIELHSIIASNCTSLKGYISIILARPDHGETFYEFCINKYKCRRLWYETLLSWEVVSRFMDILWQIICWSLWVTWDIVSFKFLYMSYKAHIKFTEDIYLLIISYFEKIPSWSILLSSFFKYFSCHNNSALPDRKHEQIKSGFHHRLYE